MIMVNKKYLLAVSGGISGFLLIADLLGTSTLCGGNRYTACMQTLHSVFLVLLPFLPLFFLVIVFFLVRAEIYAPWFRFARWWIPLSMLAIFMAPEYSHDWMFRIEKGSVAMTASALFVVISILIIAIKYFALKRSQ